MKNAKLFVLLAGLCLALACSRGEPAGAQAAASASAQTAAPAPAEPKLMTAVYQVPGLDEELVKQLTAALANKDGLVSAKPDLAGGTFQVTFTAGKLCPHSLLQTLQAVKADISLQGAGSAVEHQAGHDCGGCPHKKSCDKEH